MVLGSIGCYKIIGKIFNKYFGIWYINSFDLNTVDQHGIIVYVDDQKYFLYFPFDLLATG